MRKLAESTLVMLDDVTQAPERRASFDAESTVYSAEQLKLRRVRHGPGHLQKFTGKPDRGNKPDQADSDPRPAAVTFVTTEHFTLQGARSSTISESTGRASVFLQAVSGGLIALGLVATAAKTGAAFYMFGLILLPTLAFVGLATFHRVLQSGIEDLGYARRIAQLRCYYLDHAPEVAGYLPATAERLPAPGLGIGLWQQSVTAAGMIAVITAVLAGLGRRPTRSRRFWPLAGSGADRRHGRRRCGTDRADALSEFGLDPGHHGIAVPGGQAGPH